jgi:hypothetical protein
MLKVMKVIKAIEHTIVSARSTGMNIEKLQLRFRRGSVNTYAAASRCRRRPDGYEAPQTVVRLPDRTQEERGGHDDYHQVLRFGAQWKNDGQSAPALPRRRRSQGDLDKPLQRPQSLYNVSIYVSQCKSCIELPPWEPPH